MIKNLLLTGASGWFGKSFIYEGYRLYGDQFLRDNFFAASAAKSLAIPGIPKVVKCISLEAALGVKTIDFLVQSAFITRDKIKTLGDEQYIIQNQEIIDKSEQLSRLHKLKAHVVISSGAAIHDRSLYGVLKTVEEHRALTGTATDKKIFRVYGASGIFLPDSEWSALSQFVRCYHESKDVNIRATGRVLRSFVDFSDLSNIIIRYLEEGKIYPEAIIDACNIEVDLVELAGSIASMKNINVVLPPGFSQHEIVSDYRGEATKFLELAGIVGYNLSGLKGQINASLRSFEFLNSTH